MRALDALSQAFQSRVLVLEHGELVRDLDTVEAKVRQFLQLGAPEGRAFSRVVATTQPGRTAALLDRPVLDAARTGWSMPEIAIFHEICGERSAALGHPVDIAASERTRPLDLVYELLHRGHSVGGMVITPGDRRQGAPMLSCSGLAGPPGAALHVSPIAAGRRRRFRLRMSLNEADGGSTLRVELTESLLRRPIFGETLSLLASEEAVVDVELPSHDGLLDLILSRTSSQTESSFQAALHEAVIS